MLIVPLDRNGDAEKSYVLGKPRMIDVLPGDTVQHTKGRSRVIGVNAWQETYVPAGARLPKDGYVVRSRS